MHFPSQLISGPLGFGVISEISEQRLIIPSLVWNKNWSTHKSQVILGNLNSLYSSWLPILAQVNHPSSCTFPIISISVKPVSETASSEIRILQSPFMSF